MSLRILVFVCLRIYAIYFGLQLVTTIPLLLQFMTMGPSSRTDLIPLAVVPLAMIITAVILWVFANRLATQLVREFVPSTIRFDLTLESAYNFAFVFLGLYFVLSSIANALQHLYFIVAVVAQLSENDPERSKAFSDFYRPAITVVVGFAAMLFAPFWTRKLIAFGVKAPQ